MSQVLTPEELAALLEGLRETEDEPGSPCCDFPREIKSRSLAFPEGARMSGYHNLSNWLMALADLRWPHL
jgi:hypothetical protein